MRDLDLVVSVAHAGGVDPEATASLRAASADPTMQSYTESICSGASAQAPPPVSPCVADG